MFTQIVPIYNGYVVSSAARKATMAGRNVTEFLNLQLAKNNIHMLSSGEREIVKCIKERTCKLTVDSSEKEIITGKKKKTGTFCFPDGQTLQANQTV